MSLWENLIKNQLIEYMETQSENAVSQLEKELGYALPEEFHTMWSKCKSWEITGDTEPLYMWNINKISGLSTDDELMDDLPGLLIIGSDFGGNYIAYDPQNSIGRGAFYLYFVPRVATNLDQIVPIAHNFTELVQKSHDPNGKGFYDFPNLKKLKDQSS